MRTILLCGQLQQRKRFRTTRVSAYECFHCTKLLKVYENVFAKTSLHVDMELCLSLLRNCILYNKFYLKSKRALTFSKGTCFLSPFQKSRSALWFCKRPPAILSDDRIFVGILDVRSREVWLVFIPKAAFIKSWRGRNNNVKNIYNFIIILSIRYLEVSPGVNVNY